MAKAQHARRYRKLPEFLRHLREDAGLTQRALAERLKSSQSWVHKTETGERRADVAEFIDWARACDTDPEDAFRRILADK